jgi:hypothetical protein
MKETYRRRVSAWVAEHLTDAFMLGGGVVFYGGMFYRPLAVAWAAANVLLFLAGFVACFAAFVAVQFRRDGDCPCCRPGRDGD